MLGLEVTFLECGETCVGYPVIISVTLTVCDPTGYAISACRMSGQSGVRACGFFENSPRLPGGARRQRRAAQAEHAYWGNQLWRAVR